MGEVLAARDATHDSGVHPELSIVVPIRNESRFIAATLEQLTGQEMAPQRFEIIVVDGQSSDDTCDIVRQFVASHPTHQIRLLSNPRRLSSSARNIGVRESKGDYVLIVDGHVSIPSKRLLGDAIEVAKSSGAKVLGRPQRLNPDGIDETQALIAAVRASRIGHSAESYIFSDAEGWVPPGSIGTMYARAIFDQFGLFDERFDAAEDFEFNTRVEDAGILCFTSPRLEINYFPRSSVLALFRQMIRYGLGRGRMIRKQKKVRSLSSILPALAVLCAVGLVMASPFQPILIAVLAVLGLAYASLIGVVQASDTGLRKFSFPRVVLISIAIHCGAGIGLIRGVLSRFPAHPDVVL